MDDNGVNIFDRFSKLFENKHGHIPNDIESQEIMLVEDENYASTVSSQEKRTGENEGALIHSYVSNEQQSNILVFADMVEGDALPVTSFDDFGMSLSRTGLVQSSSIKPLFPEGSGIGPQPTADMGYPAAIPVESEITQTTANVHDGPKTAQSYSKPQLLSLHRKLRRQWGCKIYLQTSCGYEMTDNPRVAEVIEKAIKTIRELEAHDAALCRQMNELVSDQANLLDRIACYKKFYT